MSTEAERKLGLNYQMRQLIGWGIVSRPKQVFIEPQSSISSRWHGDGQEQRTSRKTLAINGPSLVQDHLVGGMNHV